MSQYLSTVLEAVHSISMVCGDFVLWLQVVCGGAGKPSESLQLRPDSLPHALEWGQVLVEWRWVTDWMSG